MQMISVSSSNVAAVGYDKATATLHVRFHSGSVYVYYNVPESVYLGLMSAGSKGSYIHSHLKGRYGDTKIG